MRECRVMTAEGNGVSFRDDGLTATIAAHICKHTNFHWIVHFTNALGWTVCHTMNYTLICWSVQSLSRVWLCDPMNRSMPGLPVHHQLPKSTQTHVHRVGDAIQPSHPLSSPAPPALNLSQHQGLFQWVSSPYHCLKTRGRENAESISD